MPVFDKYCLPTPNQSEEVGKHIKIFEESVKRFMASSNAESYISDIMSCRDLLEYTILTGILMGMAYLVLLRYFGGPIIYLSIFCIVSTFGSAGYTLWDIS